jgi:hypothetical protein
MQGLLVPVLIQRLLPELAQEHFQQLVPASILQMKIHQQAQVLL